MTPEASNSPNQPDPAAQDAAKPGIFKAAGGTVPHGPAESVPGGWRGQMLAKHRWLIFVLPLAVFMVGTSIEPKPPRTAAHGDAAETERGWLDLGIEYRHYPLLYSAKIALTVAAILLVLPGYREFPLRVGPLSIVVGLIGGLLWIGLCGLELERRVLPALGLGGLIDMGQRSGFNPLEQLAEDPAWAYGFLAIRFVGLVGAGLVEGPLRHGQPHGAGGGHRRADADAPGRAGGGRRVVLAGDMADGPHAQHLGLRRGPRHHEPDPGRVRGGLGAVGVVVRGRGAKIKGSFVGCPSLSSELNRPRLKRAKYLLAVDAFPAIKLRDSFLDLAATLLAALQQPQPFGDGLAFTLEAAAADRGLHELLQVDRDFGEIHRSAPPLAYVSSASTLPPLRRPVKTVRSSRNGKTNLH
jgi:hypothetical protein